MLIREIGVSSLDTEAHGSCSAQRALDCISARLHIGVYFRLISAPPHINPNSPPFLLITQFPFATTDRLRDSASLICLIVRLEARISHHDQLQSRYELVIVIHIDYRRRVVGIVFKLAFPKKKLLSRLNRTKIGSGLACYHVRWLSTKPDTFNGAAQKC